MRTLRSEVAYYIYQICYWIDKKLAAVEDYRGETAPYCGYGYSGHTGRLTESYFTEVSDYIGCRFPKWIRVEVYNISFGVRRESWEIHINWKRK